MPAQDPGLGTFDECIRHWAKAAPARTVVTDADRSINFAEFEQLTAQAVSMLLEAGVGKGDRIAWIGKNSDLYFLLMAAAGRVGVVMTPVGWRLAPREWAMIVNDSQARLLFAGDGFEDALHAIADQLETVHTIITPKDARARINAAKRCNFTPSDRHDPALQLYTSGTTGRPKGVVLSNWNLFGKQPGQPDYPEAWLGTWHDDEHLGEEGVLGASPCSHISGSGIYAMALAAGAATHLLPEFDAGTILDLIRKGKITRLLLVPAALQLLLQDPRCDGVGFDRIKYVLYGASAISPALLRECMQMFQAKFCQGYGMTETTGGIVMLPPDDHDPDGNPRMQSAGLPLPGVEIRIRDAEGHDLPQGATGEIVTRSSSNMLGYWNLPEETARTVDADGWLKTGDAGYVDADGYLYIQDRVKDMIISGGENIYPVEVENVLADHPAVLECAVIGIPDVKWGETVKAICVPRTGQEIDPAELIEWTRERLAHFKCPRSVDLMAALPRNAAGKVLRRELREPFWRGHKRRVN